MIPVLTVPGENLKGYHGHSYYSLKDPVDRVSYHRNNGSNMLLLTCIDTSLCESGTFTLETSKLFKLHC